MLVAVLSYGVQGSLQSAYARRYDPMVVALLRNVSLVVTMLPALFFVSFEEIRAIREHVIVLLLASSLGACSLVCALSAVRYLPIGISSAIRQMAHVGMALTLGALFFNEGLSPLQSLLLALLVGAGIALSLSRSNHNHLDPRMLRKGVGLTILAGVIVAHSFFFFSMLSREVNPIVAGYFLESGIGLFALLYAAILHWSGVRAINLRVPIRDALKIVFIALLTISGTISFARAVNHGPYGLATGFLTTTSLVASVVGWLLYKEQLSRTQVGILFFAVFCMLALKTISGS